MKKTILAVCCIITLVVSCKKKKGNEGPQGPQGNPGAAALGTISGRVDQYDHSSTQYTSGLNTTTVSVDGTDISTVTDASGKYTLKNVPSGILEISFNKPGAGLVKRQQVNFPGNGTLYIDQSISDKPSFLFTQGQIKDTVAGGMAGVKINLASTSTSSMRYAIIIFSKSSNLDIADPNSYQGEWRLTIYPNNNGYSDLQYYYSSPFDAFSSGTTIFAKVYPLGMLGTGYYNYELDKAVYTNYGTPLAGTFSLTKP